MTVAYFTKEDQQLLRVADRPLMLVDYAGTSWLINRSVNGYVVSQYDPTDGRIIHQTSFFELADAEQLVLKQLTGTVAAMQ